MSLKHVIERHPWIPGSLFLVGAVQFLLMLLVSTSLYPDYNVNFNYISDLGATCDPTGCFRQQPSSIIFNSTTFLFGLLTVIGFVALSKQSGMRLFIALGGLSSVGAMGVGIFTEEFLTLHGAIAMLAFGFGALTAITAYRDLRRPFNIFGAVMGLAGLGIASAFLYLSYGNPALGNTATLGGLGIGSLERLLIYVIVLWQLGLGIHLLNIRLESPQT